MLQQPNATLYLKNIDWKIKKPLLKRALYFLFSRYGKVLEVVVLRRDGLRGQAWVIMEDIPAATAALQAVNGFTFFEKDLVVEYAKEKSDRIARRDGTYIPKSKRKKSKPQQQQQENSESQAANKDEVDDSRQNIANDDEGNTSNAISTAVVEDLGEPSKYVLAQQLPAECNEMMLAMLFRQYAGYKEVRMPRPGLAFVEFDDEPHATLALQGLNGFKLTTTEALRLSYGKS